MQIREATRDYEAWLGGRLPLIPADLRRKHDAMSKGAFPFLRATFHRWAQIWPDVCASLASAPRVLAVGDLHVENFGTWRDAEGRLAWGVNDFDEAYPMPYASDLVRLATSVELAALEKRLDSGPGAACDAILEGYAACMARGGRPFVLAERTSWLRTLAVRRLRDPAKFWAKFDGLRTTPASVPTAVRRALAASFPEPGRGGRIVHRRAGVGSLGRRRFALLLDWRGGRVAREAKELAASACAWAAPPSSPERIWADVAAKRAVRAQDPFFRVQDGWAVRRLAPDCGGVELSEMPGRADELRFLRAMGAETANVHCGTPGARRRVLADLAARPSKWLRRAGAAMAEATVADWNDWRRGRR